MRGSVLEGVDAEALALLDAYEGSHYERVTVQVELPDGGACVAYAHVLAI